MSTPLARRMALDILRRCLDHAQDLQAATDETLSTSPAGPDRGLATELACGALRYRGRLDFLLNQLLKNPAQTSAALRRILQMAAYELLFLSRVPEYATLDWAVTLVRERLGQTMSQVANGVLRSLIRLGPSVHRPGFYETKTAGRAQFLAAWYACPLWLAQMWLNAYGLEQTELFLAATLQLPPAGVRINQRHPGAETLCAHLATTVRARSAWGFALESWPDMLEHSVRQGCATRQSLASQRIMDELKAEVWPEPILDACAGRGGKTLLLREMGREVWASDVNMFRLRQLVDEQKRLGLSGLVFRAPAQGPYPLGRTPRTIFLDVPCSGLGVLSRRPDIKWKRTLTDCADLVALQGRILAGAATLLPVGGCLAYVTCTLNPDENQKQIQAFCAAHPHYRLLVERQTDPACGLGEFFYGAVLVRNA